jgi:hypothetical protein
MSKIDPLPDMKKVDGITLLSVLLYRIIDYCKGRTQTTSGCNQTHIRQLTITKIYKEWKPNYALSQISQITSIYVSAPIFPTLYCLPFINPRYSNDDPIKLGIVAPI